MLKHFAASAALLALLGTASQAQQVVYSNLRTAQGGLVVGSNTGVDTATNLIADDINPINGTAGKGVTQFTFAAYNSATTSVSVNLRFRFYDDQNPDFSGNEPDGPGTYLGGVDLTNRTLARGVTLITYTAPAGSIFTIPSDQSFWAGVVFDVNGLSTTAAVLNNNIGVEVYNPATVGGSDNMFFDSDDDATGPGYFASNNPVGGEYILGTSAPAANFGWAFQIAAAPEPSQFAAFGLGILGVGALAVRARRRRCAAA